jgi:hypothetical protein
MSISVNKSPLAGREGKLLQSRVIRDRLFKELDRNVALKVTLPFSSVCLQLVHISYPVLLFKRSLTCLSALVPACLQLVSFSSLL